MICRFPDRRQLNLPEEVIDAGQLPVLAGQAGMSERSFSRHYAEATGLTPARAIERLRVEGRSGASIVIGIGSSSEADLFALWLRVGGDDAPKLPTTAGGHATRVSHAFQRSRATPVAARTQRQKRSGAESS